MAKRGITGEDIAVFPDEISAVAGTSAGTIPIALGTRYPFNNLPVGREGKTGGPVSLRGTLETSHGSVAKRGIFQLSADQSHFSSRSLIIPSVMPERYPSQTTTSRFAGFRVASADIRNYPLISPRAPLPPLPGAVPGQERRQEALLRGLRSGACPPLAHGQRPIDIPE